MKETRPITARFPEFWRAASRMKPGAKEARIAAKVNRRINLQKSVIQEYDFVRAILCHIILIFLFSGGSINGYRKDNTVLTTYDFAIPHHLVGRLIGRHGNFLQGIRTKADVDIYVNDHPCNGDHKICSIQGSAEGVNLALKMIRQKFPEKKFPQVTLAEISTLSDIEEIPTFSIPLITSTLPLIDGVSNDVNISHIVKPNWLFVQLPTHPSYPYLQNLEEEMTCLYNNVCADPVVDAISSE